MMSSLQESFPQHEHAAHAYGPASSVTASAMESIRMVAIIDKPPELIPQGF
jgi:hypothetical protein